MWDKSAPGYDKQIAFFEKIWSGRGRGRRARPRPGPGVAIGTGRNLPHYLPGAAVTGIELSPATLAIARQRAAGLGRDVGLREGDAEHLPGEDASFDTVVCALSLCTIPGPAAAISEMQRVLVPGGRLLLLDHIGSTWPPVRAAQWLLEAMAEAGIDISREFSKSWTEEFLLAADVAITMGCGDACPLLPAKHYEDWKLEDPAGKTLEEIRPIRGEIKDRVANLLEKLASM